jgi:hypothetical protein
MLTSSQSGADLPYGNGDYGVCSSGAVTKLIITECYYETVEIFTLSSSLINVDTEKQIVSVVESNVSSSELDRQGSRSNSASRSFKSNARPFILSLP